MTGLNDELEGALRPFLGLGRASSQPGVTLFEDSPVSGVNTYASTTLHAHSTQAYAYGKELAIEVLLPAPAQLNAAPEILQSAIHRLTQLPFVFPGMLAPGVIHDCDPSLSTKHLFLKKAFLWGNLGDFNVTLNDRIITWLQLIPLTESERVFALENGVEALDAELSAVNIDVLDFSRAPAV